MMILDHYSALNCPFSKGFVPKSLQVNAWC